MDNRKFYTKGTWFLFLISLFLFGCSGAHDNIVKESLSKNEGWVDTNTYRITAEGRPLQEKKQLEEKKQSALNAAIIHAQFKLWQVLIGEQRHSKLTEIKKIKRIINKGKVIYNKFDLEGNCEIVYEIHHDNLKNIAISQNNN